MEKMVESYRETMGRLKERSRELERIFRNGRVRRYIM